MHLVTSTLLVAAIVAGAPTLLRTGGPLHEWSGMDFHYLTLPVLLVSLLVFLSRVVLLARMTKFATLSVPLPVVAEQQSTIGMISTAQRLLADSAWVALAWGALSSVPHLPGTFSVHPSLPDINSAAAYLEVFDSLAIWSIVILTPFVIARRAAEVWPRLSRTAQLPVALILGFGVAYVFLADGGVASVAFGFPGSRVLLGLSVALGLSYTASVLRVEVSRPLPSRLAPLARVMILLTEAGWVVALLGAVAALPSAAESALASQDGGGQDTWTPYLALLRQLALWSIPVLTPFAVARATAPFWTGPSSILGFPMWRLALLALIYVLFSERGILSVTFELPGSQFMTVLTVAVALTYLPSVLNNLSRFGLAGRSARVVGYASPVVNAVVAGVVPALVAWVTIGNLPLVADRLLDYPLTQAMGETYGPVFTALSGVRYAAAGLCLAIGLALRLPEAMGTTLVRYQVLVSAVGYSVAACLAWILGSSLSELNHGYTLAGAVAAAGLFSLSLTQLAGYGASSSNTILSEASRWLSESKVRGFIVGASVAFYGLLLQPALHEVMWFATLYEYLVVLALMVFMLLRMRKRVSVEDDARSVPSPPWPKWSRHEQRIETKPDPRASLMRDLRYRFLDYGDWRDLWTYIMVLLYCSQAPLESVETVCRTFRRAAPAPAGWALPGERARIRSRRAAALVECISSAEAGLAATTLAATPVDEPALRHAAEEYVQTGSEPERLTSVLIYAYYQKGEDIAVAVDRWFPLLSSPEPSHRWYEPPWIRSRNRARERDRRARLVDACVAYLFWGRGSTLDRTIGDHGACKYLKPQQER